MNKRRNPDASAAKARNYVTEAQATVRGTTIRLPPSKIRPNKWNYNTESPEMFGKLVNVIRKRGFIDRPTVRKVGPDQWEYINGEHRHLAAEALAMGEIEVVDLGEVSDEEAKQLCIEGNEFKGKPDEVRLADLLRDISTSVDFDELASTMPFSERELRVYVDSVDFSFSKFSTEDTREPPPEQTAPPGGKPEPADDTTAKFDRLVLTYPVGEAQDLRKQLRQIDEDPATAVRAAVEWYIKHKTKKPATAAPKKKKAPAAAEGATS